MEVLKITDKAERDKLEKWTDENTFPDIIRFVQDANGEFIVGEEILSDPAYEKLGLISNSKSESLKAYIVEKAIVVEYAKPIDAIIDPLPIDVLPLDIKPI